MSLRSWWTSLTAALGRGIPASFDSGPFQDTAANTGWEAEAVRLYDIVPELRYGISWAASSASRAVLVCAKVPDHPAAPPEPIDDDAPEALPLRELVPTAPDQAAFLHRIASLLKLVGKWWLVGFDDPDTGARRWLVLSDREFSCVGDQIWLRHPDTGTQIKLWRLHPELDQAKRGSAAWVIPMWHPHPVNSTVPDSPVRALIDTLHELVDLSGHVQTAAKSRLAGAGLLLMPSSLKPVAPGQSTGVNPPNGNPAMRALVRTAQASLKNPHDVSRHLPVIFEGQQEALNAVRHLTLDTPFDERVDSLRTSAVRRIAIGLDIPPEVLTGMGELNHWTAWAVNESGQKLNVAPALAQICREITRKYYWPALRAMGVAEPQQYMIWYDDTSLEGTPNKDEVSLRAFELGVISPDAVRETLGYGPEDAPPPGWVPPLVRARQTRPGSLENGYGPASTEQTQVGIPGAGNGWVACADVAARRALGRAGQHLLTAGGRGLRGKYRDVPLHEIHTKVGPGNAETARSAMRGAFTELSDVEPGLVEPVAAYTWDRLTTRKAHDVAVLAKYLTNNDMGGTDAGHD